MSGIFDVVKNVATHRNINSEMQSARTKFTVCVVGFVARFFSATGWALDYPRGGFARCIERLSSFEAALIRVLSLVAPWISIQDARRLSEAARTHAGSPVLYPGSNEIPSIHRQLDLTATAGHEQDLNHRSD